MRKIIFICLRYLDDKLENITIGGIQTYITNLIKVAKDLGLKCVVVQPSSKPFSIVFDGTDIFGITIPRKARFAKFKRMLFNAAKAKYEDGDIILFATERLSVKSNIPNTIAIQHGISWDITTPKNRSKIQRAIFAFRRAYRAISLIDDGVRVKKLVCVDCNYINWLRTQVDSVDIDYVYIPNFSSIPEKPYDKSDDGIVRIVFARRLQDFRGTRLFGKAIKRILDNYKNVLVTIAGDGPDEMYLKQLLNGYHVLFTTYNSNEALSINRDKHIAVVPSLGSEGTSLSLIEAMASGCAPIATDVGGMTNIILDGFNGLLIKPVEDCLFKSIERLINNKDEREMIAKNAYETAKVSFSYERWKKQWRRIIEEVIE